MKIVVYGPGCARCHETERVVLATPAVSIDGVLKLSGRIPKAEEVQVWLRA
jgi:hypothetical protein